MIARIIDLETCGMQATDDVVEIGSVDLDIQSGSVFNHQSAFVHPVFPIPPGAMAVHHITDDMVAEAQPWMHVYPHYLDAYRWQDIYIFVAHMAQFEGQYVSEEMRSGRPLICTYKAALRVWPEAPGHSNQVLRYFLKLDVDLGGELPHRALPDAIVTCAVLRELLRHVTIEQMIEWTAEPALLPRIKFGKHAGAKWSDLSTDYLNWLVNPKKNDLDEDVRWNARRELSRRAVEERETYVAAACAEARRMTSIDALRSWFRADAPIRQRFGISNESPEHDRIVTACEERKAELEVST